MGIDHYTKLNRSTEQIRLLRLYPLQSDGKIRCDLFTADLGNRPFYEALSYVWGKSRLNYAIEVNGNTIYVTDNLYYALRHLQSANSHRILWVDQLCINQADKAERGHQVSLMGKIYSNSSQTMLWLGEEVFVDPYDIPRGEIRLSKTKSCNWCLTTCDESGNMLSRPFFAAESHPQGSIVGESDLTYSAFLLVAQLANENQPHCIQNFSKNVGQVKNIFRALWFIMHRPWWNRVWTFQEVVLSHDPLLMYGPVTAPFDMFLKAAIYYHTLTKLKKDDGFQRLDSESVRTLRHFDQTLMDIHLHCHVTKVTKVDLVETLRLLRTREAADERDKIYGFLGLNIAWNGEEPLYPNYQLNTSEVFINSTFKLIKVSRSLKILINSFDRHGDSRKTASMKRPEPLPMPQSLSLDPGIQALLQQIDVWKSELSQNPFFIDSEMNHLDLPSWVPNWSSPTNFEVLARYRQAETYSASQSTEPCPVLRDETTLILRGFEVDEVRWSSQIMAFNDKNDRSKLFREWRLFAEDAFVYESNLGRISNQPVCYGVSPLEETFWRTLCGDTLSVEGDGSKSSTEVHYELCMRWCMAEAPELTSFSQRLDFFSADAEGQSTDSDGEIASALDVDPVIRAATTMRRMFVTRKGFLGLGPAQAVGGEKIFVLHGGKTPFLLRQTTAPTQQSNIEYELVGDCYVHGIMFGEAMDWGIAEQEVHII